MISKTVTIFNNELELQEDSVFNKTTNKDVTVHLLNDGQRFILVDNIKLNYGLVKLTAHNKCYLPIKHWEGCKVGFRDGDKDNYHIGNIYIIFPKGGIESERRKGFKYIPGYELNLVNEKGEVYRRIEGKIVTSNQSARVEEENKWYPQVAVEVNPKLTFTSKLHRLVALAWCEPPENYPDLVVDHINGDKSDFRPENLEWVSHQENSDRAVGMGFHATALEIVVLDKKTGKVTDYRSLKQMAEKLNLIHDSVSEARRNQNQTYRDRYVIKDKGDDTPWEVFTSITRSSAAKPLKARNAHTGEIRLYPGFVEAARDTGIDRSTIRNYFKFFKKPYLIKGVELKLQEDDSPWFEFNEYDLEKDRRGMHAHAKVYELVDLLNDEVHICYGWKEASDITGIGHRNVLKAVQDNIVIKGRFTIRTISS